MTPEAEFLLKHIGDGWIGTRTICLAAGITFPDGSACHTPAYKPLKELLGLGLIEKRVGALHHARYSEYRKVADTDLTQASLAEAGRLLRENA